MKVLLVLSLSKGGKRVLAIHFSLEPFLNTSTPPPIRDSQRRTMGGYTRTGETRNTMQLGMPLRHPRVPQDSPPLPACVLPARGHFGMLIGNTGCSH